MRSTQQFSITLPHEMANMIAAKIDAGTYSSVSEVVREGLRALMGREVALERWLQQVAQGHAEYLADPSQGVPAEEVLARIKARRTLQ